MALFVLNKGVRVVTTPEGAKVQGAAGEDIQLTPSEVQVLARVARDGLEHFGPSLPPALQKLADLGLLTEFSAAGHPAQRFTAVDEPIDVSEMSEASAAAATRIVPAVRADLKITQSAMKGVYEVQAPGADRRFALYDFEVSLARMLDGKRTVQQLIDAAAKLGIPADPTSISKFVRQLELYGFLRKDAPATASAPPADGSEGTWPPRKEWEEKLRTLYQTGLKLSREGRYGEAAAYFDAMLVLAPGNTEAVEMLSQNRGLQAQQEQDFPHPPPVASPSAPRPVPTDLSPAPPAQATATPPPIAATSENLFGDLSQIKDTSSGAPNSEAPMGVKAGAGSTATDNEDELLAAGLKQSSKKRTMSLLAGVLATAVIGWGAITFLSDSAEPEPVPPPQPTAAAQDPNALPKTSDTADGSVATAELDAGHAAPVAAVAKATGTEDAGHAGTVAVAAKAASAEDAGHPHGVADSTKANETKDAGQPAQLAKGTEKEVKDAGHGAAAHVVPTGTVVEPVAAAVVKTEPAANVTVLEPKRRGRATMGELVASRSGTLEQSVALDERVTKRQAIGTLAPPKGKPVSLLAPNAGLVRWNVEAGPVKQSQKLAKILYHQAYLMVEMKSGKPTREWRCSVVSSADSRLAPCNITVIEKRSNGLQVTVTSEPTWVETAPEVKVHLSPP